jgi:hypothetical protein
MTTRNTFVQLYQRAQKRHSRAGSDQKHESHNESEVVVARTDGVGLEPTVRY